MAILQGSAKSVADGGFYPTEIAQSLRFNDDSGSTLTRTTSSAGNDSACTFSFWAKLGSNLSGRRYIITGDAGATYQTSVLIDSYKISLNKRSATEGDTIASPLLRDPSAWYHIVVSYDSTQALGSRGKIYINGVDSTESDSTSGAINWCQSGVLMRISNDRNNSQSWHYDGYLAEVHFTDGTAYTADDFGELKNGVWVAKTPSVTYGTNGFYLNFSNSGSLGADSSGNANNWTTTNLAATDQMLDSPTNNFATLNPLATRNRQAALAEGNLYASLTATSADNCYSNFKLPTSGKWYWETHHLRTGHGLAIGITKDEYAGNLSVPSTAYTYYNADGTKWNNNSGTAYGSSFFATSTWYTVGVYYDADAGTVGFTLDGVDQGTAFTGLNTSDGYYACASNESGSGTINVYWNFGQDSSFAGTKTPQGNTDANGIGDFYYAPPTGYLALCTANLPEPAISPANGASPTDYFNTVLVSGNASTNVITGVGFQPDLVWGKNRGGVGNHMLVDIIRGPDVRLISNLANAEDTGSGITSFDTDGFTLHSGSTINQGGTSNVAWNWLAGGTAVSNTDGTITSSVSANTESGFSIVSYTGNGSSSASIGHGLTSAPEMMILKDRGNAVNWYVWHNDGTTLRRIEGLNTTAAAVTSGLITSFNASTFDYSTTTADFNGSGKNYICYCFNSVEGFSKFGSYTGNGSTDGPFVYCGFKPAFVMVKGYTTATNTNWQMSDGTRDPYNQMGNGLFANQSNAERSFDYIDFLSNGFKLRQLLAESNGNGVGYIYMAFAEDPFKYSNAR